MNNSIMNDDNENINSRSEITIYNSLIIVILSFLTTIFFESAQLILKNNIKPRSIIEFIKYLNSINILIYFLFLTAVMFIVYIYNKPIGYYLYKYRYAAAITVFVLCVIFEINGSSIGLWKEFLPSSGENINGVLIGKSRMIRTDEWATNTAMTFSQYFNKPENFSYFSNTIRGTSTDCFILYGQPIKNFLMIYRPFQIGYLLFSPERGLAFFWSGRIIALFMITFEMAMVITKKNKNLSVLSAFLITFAPAVQWWFAINGFVEMLFFGQLAIFVIYKYVRTKNYQYRSLYSVVLSICAGGYILTLYPAWMVPFAYVFLALLVWVVIENYKKFKFNFKKDVPIICMCVVIVAVSMIYVLSKSTDTINLVTETVYPGKRVSLGGSGFGAMWQYISNLFFAYTDKNIPLNVCEMSEFFDFFPAGLLISLFVIIKEKKKDSLLISLIIVDILLTAYCTLSFPTFLAKITLLSNSPTTRAYIAVGFINILLLVRSLTLIKTKINSIVAVILSLICSAFVTFFAKHSTGDYLTNIMVIICYIVLFEVFLVIFMSINNNKKKVMAISGIVIILVSGFFVNPIRTGAGEVTYNEFLNRVKEISENDDGLWIVEGMGLPSNNALILAGARTINSTNVYPALERWNSIDVDKKYENVYNRYAHIRIDISDRKETSFVLSSNDAFDIQLSVDDINKLGVKYILTTRDLSIYSNDKVKLNFKESIGNYRIYQIE